MHDRSTCKRPEYLVLVYDDNNFAVKQATKKGYIICKNGGVADLSFPNSKLRRGRFQGNGEICPTLTTSSNIYRLEEINESK